MQIDMELIRKILFKIEDTIDNIGKTNLQIEGYSKEQVAYHCAILYEGGYIHACNIQYGSNEVYSFSVGRLTWEGHEFLECVHIKIASKIIASIITAIKVASSLS